MILKKQILKFFITFCFTIICITIHAQKPIKKVIKSKLIDTTFKATNNELLNQIKKQVRKYFSETMNDYKSYDPVNWGDVEIIFKEFNSDGRWNFILKNINSNDSISRNLDLKIQSNNAETRKINDFISAKYYENEKIEGNYEDRKNRIVNENRILIAKRDSCILLSERFNTVFKDQEKEFKKDQIIGFYVHHTFRAKNLYGGVILKTIAVSLDSKLNITEIKDI